MAQTEGTHAATSGQWHLVAQDGDLTALVDPGMLLGEDAAGCLSLRPADALVELGIHGEHLVVKLIVADTEVQSPPIYVDNHTRVRLILPHDTFLIDPEWPSNPSAADTIEIRVSSRFPATLPEVTEAPTPASPASRLPQTRITWPDPLLAGVVVVGLLGIAILVWQAGGGDANNELQVAAPVANVAAQEPTVDPVIEPEPERTGTALSPAADVEPRAQADLPALGEPPRTQDTVATQPVVANNEPDVADPSADRVVDTSADKVADAQPDSVEAESAAAGIAALEEGLETVDIAETTSPEVVADTRPQAEEVAGASRSQADAEESNDIAVPAESTLAAEVEDAALAQNDAAVEVSAAETPAIEEAAEVGLAGNQTLDDSTLSDATRQEFFAAGPALPSRIDAGPVSGDRSEERLIAGLVGPPVLPDGALRGAGPDGLSERVNDSAAVSGPARAVLPGVADTPPPDLDAAASAAQQVSLPARSEPPQPDPVVAAAAEQATLYPFGDLVVVRQAPPTYPRRAPDGASGVVDISFTVTERGRVIDVEVEGPAQDYFARAAVNAVSKWRFEAVVVDGKPTAVRTMLRLSFRG